MKRRIMIRVISVLFLAVFLTAFFAACTGNSGTVPADSSKTNIIIEEGSGTEYDWEGLLKTEPDREPLKGGIVLPSSSLERSDILAEQALLLCSGHTGEKENELFKEIGFDVLLQSGYDKEEDDPSHTCAFTIALGKANAGNEDKPLIVCAIRGTDSGEWYSNIDFAPSHSDDSQFAENFLFAAEDVFLQLEGVLASFEDPLILICGHSRGAACANILAMLEDQIRGEEGIYAYTFATPATWRGDGEYGQCGNIFNYLNPCDIVPSVPLKAWGYRRFGTDIMLGGDPARSAQIREDISSLYDIAPTVSAYYEDRHSLSEEGLSDDGASAFEVMMMLASFLSQQTEEAEDSDIEIPDISDVTELAGDSDLKPLFDLIARASAENGKEAYEILRQHLPFTYQELIRSGS